MMTLPTMEQIDKAKQNRVWDFGNKILYDLCRDNFMHVKDEQILTKVLFIGRIYATALERRKKKDGKKDENKDNFYVKTLAPAFKEPKLDDYLKELKTIKNLNEGSIITILKVHGYLIDKLKAKTRHKNHSFCSKYLHFHLPDLFFIYDSRAVSALRHFTKQVPKDLKSILEIKGIDTEYAKFYCKCFDIKRQIEKRDNTTLTIRQIDNILIDEANKKLVK